MASVGNGKSPPEGTGASIGAGYMDSEQDVNFRLRLVEGMLAGG